MNQDSQSQIHFENSHIHLNVEKQSGCKIKFSITTQPLATKAAEAAAVKAISKEVNIPGFRKGRAPDALVTSQFKGQIKKEFADILTKNSFSEAIKLSGIHPLNNESRVNLTKCEPLDESSYLIEIDFDAYPDVPEVDPKTLSILDQPPEPVTEDQINNHIEELRLHHCSWEEITDRPAESGNFVTLKIDLIEDGNSKTIHENNRFHLKEGKLPSWLHKLVLGLSVNESASGSSEPEKEETATNFHPKKFAVQLIKIEKAILPVIDDDLAKKAGVENIEALYQAITKSLEKDATNRSKQKMRFAIKNALLESYPFELPGGRLKELLNECTRIANEDNAASKEEQEQKMMKLFTQGKNNMAFSYLVYKLFKDNKLHYPSPQEIRQRATEEMLMRYMQGDRNISENDLEYYTRSAENEIVAETALDYLIEHSKRA